MKCATGCPAGARAWSGVALVLGLFAFGAGAGTIQDSASDASHQALAQLFPSVGRLAVHGSVGNYSGSGTLIGDDWVLTAASLVGGASHITFRAGGNEYDIVETEISSQFTGDPTSGNDIALLRTHQPVTGVSPAPLYAGTAELGQVATYVGYGRGGVGSTGASGPAGTLRAGQNVIDSLGLEILSAAGVLTVFSERLLFSDFDSGQAVDNELGSSSPLPYEYSIASGDSGGAVFIEVGGQQRLAGVIAALVALDGGADADYGDLSASVRVSSHREWIQAVVLREAPAPVPMTGKFAIGALVATLVVLGTRASG